MYYSFYMNTTDYNDKKSVFAPAAYMHAQLPRLMDEAGMQGYIYVHPNAIAGDVIFPNQYANVSRISSFLDPVFDKMVQFPGMNPKTLFKFPPFDLSAIVPPKAPAASSSASAILGTGAFGNLPVIPSSWVGTQPKQVNNPAVPNPIVPPPPPFAKATPDIPSGGGPVAGRPRVKRHGPGQEMLLPGGRADMDSRLFGKEELEDPRMAQALEGSMPFGQMDGQIRLHLVAGPPLWNQKTNTSVHPEWRRTYVHSIATSGGTPNAQAFRDFAPQTAAYSNEVGT
jgi:hypothetical protein